MKRNENRWYGKLDKDTYFRQEKNGITIYHLLANRFEFYEGIFLETPDDIEKFDFEGLESSRNIELDHPLCVCCLAENRCNLNCIYCFGEDKMYNNRRIASVAELYDPLVKIQPIQISLGGGEPTLNPMLGEIIDYISAHEIAILVDTNGTTEELQKIISVVKRNDVLVRVSIDSLNDEIIQKVRPYKGKIEISVAERIKKNIAMLLDNEVGVTVQTVLSRINLKEMKEIADFLVKKGIKRWHISGVKYSEKCKSSYDSISITEKEILETQKRLSEYKKYIDITFAYEKDYGPNARLFFDVNGEFLTDSIVEGLNYLGKNPQLTEIYKKLDKNGHIQRYLGDFYI